jgi:hypothetical protein
MGRPEHINMAAENELLLLQKQTKEQEYPGIMVLSATRVRSETNN